MSTGFPIPSSVRRVDLTATASQTVFTFPYPVLANQDVAVAVKAVGTLNFVALTYGADFTVSGAPSSSSVSVTLSTPATAGAVYRLTGARIPFRTTSLAPYGTSYRAALENELDNITLVLQELRRDFDRLEDYSNDADAFVQSLPAFTGDSGSGGVKGLVPAPAAGDTAAGRFLAAGGTFSAPTFTQTGTGVVSRLVTAKLQDVISVKDFGATGNGSTNDTAAFVAAIAYTSSATGGVGRGIYVPSGYYILSPNSITFSSPCFFYGDGYSTQLVNATAGGTLFTVAAQQVWMSNFSIRGAVTQTAGVYIDITSAASDVYISNFNIDGALKGIRTSSPALVYIADGEFLNSIASTGVAIEINDGVALGLSNLVITSASQIYAGVLITNTGDVTITNCQIIKAGQALFINPTAGKVVASIFASNTWFDNSTRGLYALAAGGSIVRCSFNQCWFSSATNEGIRLATTGGGGIDGMDFNGSQIFLNGADGLFVGDTGVINVNVNNCAVAQNTGAGVNVAANVDKVAVRGSRIGASHGLTANGYGILVQAGTGDNIIIADNNLNTNTTANLSFGATGSSNIVTNNIGGNIAWTTYTPTVAASSGSITTLGAVSGRYRKTDRRVDFEMSIAITTNGTGAGTVTATLPPFSPAVGFVVAGRENALTGSMVQGYIPSGGSTVNLAKYDNTYPGGNGHLIFVSGSYEATT